MAANVWLLKLSLLSKYPESKRPGVQSLRIQAPRVEASSCPESMRPESTSPSVQSRVQPSNRSCVLSPSVQASRVKASRPCVQSPTFSICTKIEFSPHIVNVLKPLSIFTNKLHLRSLTGLLIRLWCKLLSCNLDILKDFVMQNF